MGLSCCRKTNLGLPLILHYAELYNYFIIHYNVIIIKYTINLSMLESSQNHPSAPCPVEKSSSTKLTPGAKRLEIAGLNQVPGISNTGTERRAGNNVPRREVWRIWRIPTELPTRPTWGPGASMAPCFQRGHTHDSGYKQTDNVCPSSFWEPAPGLCHPICFEAQLPAQPWSPWRILRYPDGTPGTWTLCGQL